MIAVFLLSLFLYFVIWQTFFPLVPSITHTYHPLFRISAGSAPALSSKGAAEGLQPYGKTSGQRLPGPDCSLLLHSNTGHGCGMPQYSKYITTENIFKNLEEKYNLSSWFLKLFLILCSTSQVFALFIIRRIYFPFSCIFYQLYNHTTWPLCENTLY